MQLRISKITVLFIRHQDQLLELVFNRRVAVNTRLLFDIHIKCYSLINAGYRGCINYYTS